MANPAKQHVWHWIGTGLGRATTLPLIVIISAYRRLISPLLGSHCRYQPTCSAYAIEALQQHGAVKGSWLALKRIARCHPIGWLGGGQGQDPVPGASHEARKAQGS